MKTNNWEIRIKTWWIKCASFRFKFVHYNWSSRISKTVCLLVNQSPLIEMQLTSILCKLRLKTKVKTSISLYPNFKLLAQILKSYRSKRIPNLIAQVTDYLMLPRRKFVTILLTRTPFSREEEKSCFKSRYSSIWKSNLTVWSMQL